jgi:hypothetical protein
MRALEHSVDRVIEPHTILAVQWNATSTRIGQTAMGETRRERTVLARAILLRHRPNSTDVCRPHHRTQQQ